MRIALCAPRRRSGRAIAATLVLLGLAGGVRAGNEQAPDAIEQLIAEQRPVAAAAASAPSTADSAAGRAKEIALLGQVRDRAAEAVVSALNYIGVRYRRGGNSAATGFDCSGFTRFVFENSLGLVLPRQADQQAKAAGFVAVKREDLQPGDLVFFNTMRRTFSHVGIYVGDNRFIHAPSHGKDVRTDDLGLSYWAKRFTGARRADLLAQPEPAERDGP
jgi:cell wall-associated NlpC family hydrolase